MATTKKLGTLIIVALKARNLAAREVFGKGDPYATFRVGDNEQRTPADKRGGQHPYWDAEVRFEIFDLAQHKKMLVKVYNEDKRDPKIIGEMTIDLNNVLTKGEWDEWYEIKYRNKYAGEVFLEMTFYAVGAPKQPPQQVPPKPPLKSSPSPSPSPPPSFSAPTKLVVANPNPTDFAQSTTLSQNTYQPPFSNQYPPAPPSNQYPPPINNSSGQYIPPANFNNNSNQYIPPINNNNNQITNPAAYPPQNIYPPLNATSSPPPPSAQQQLGSTNSNNGPYPQFYPPPPNNNFIQGGAGYPPPSFNTSPPGNPPPFISFPVPAPTPGGGNPGFANYPYQPQNNYSGPCYPPPKN